MSKNEEAQEKAEQTVSTDMAARAGVMTRPPFFSDWFDRWPGWLGRWPDLSNDLRTQFAGGIPLEEYVDDDTLVIRAELPGVDAEDDIDIDIENGRLSIHAEREQREETRDDDNYRSEFHYGSFRRTMMLPEGTEPDDIKARYGDGILEVRVPLRGDESTPTRVPISRS